MFYIIIIYVQPKAMISAKAKKSPIKIAMWPSDKANHNKVKICYKLLQVIQVV